MVQTTSARKKTLLTNVPVLHELGAKMFCVKKHFLIYIKFTAQEHRHLLSIAQTNLVIPIPL